MAETFIDRLKVESIQLSTRREALEVFIETETFKSLPVYRQGLLAAQYSTMCAYEALLNLRIVDLEDNEN